MNRVILSQEANEKNKEAILLKHRGDLPGAIEAYRDLVRIEPTFAGGWQQLGFLLRNTGEWDAARQACETAFALDPTDLNIVRGLSMVYARDGRFAEAAEMLRGAVAGRRIEPSMCPAHLDLSYVLLLQKRWDEAKASLLNAALSDGSSVEVYYNLAWLYSSLEKWDEVLSIGMKVLQLRPNYWGIYPAIYHALRNTGRGDAAETLYRKGHALRAQEEEIGRQWADAAARVQAELDIPAFRFELFLPAVSSATDQE